MSGANGQSRLLRHGGAQAVRRRRRRRRRCRAGASGCGRGRGCGVSPRCWRDAGSRRLPTAGAWPRRRAGRRSCGGTSAWRSSGRCGIASPGRRKRRRSDCGAGPGAPHPAHRPEDASEKIINKFKKQNTKTSQIRPGLSLNYRIKRQVEPSAATPAPRAWGGCQGGAATGPRGCWKPQPGPR